MRLKDRQPISIILYGEDVTPKYELVVHSRINNCGTKFIEADNSHIALDDSISCHQLSIGNKRWIGTTGMSTYIVELVKKPKGEELPTCSECQSFKLSPLDKPYEHIFECDDCGHPNKF